MAGRVTGIGGVFFKAQDPEALAAWYRQHLGLPDQGWPGVAFDWREAGAPPRRGMTIWAPHAQDTSYFAPSQAPFMINYRVDDLDALVAKAGGRRHRGGAPERARFQRPLRLAPGSGRQQN